MEFHGKFHRKFNGIPWNFMKLRLMEFHGIPCKIPWKSVN
jgi:hypothetical protein